MSLLLSLIAAAAIPAIPAVPAEVQTIEENHALVMRTATDAKPLYTFDKDEPGKSNCTDRCATAWPPLSAPVTARATGKWTVITRADKTSQWAYDGKPVYSFIHDSSSVATGDGVGGVWHLLPTIPLP